MICEGEKASPTKWLQAYLCSAFESVYCQDAVFTAGQRSCDPEDDAKVKRHVKKLESTSYCATSYIGGGGVSCLSCAPIAYES